MTVVDVSDDMNCFQFEFQVLVPAVTGARWARSTRQLSAGYGDSDAFNVSCSHAATPTNSGIECGLRYSCRGFRNTLGDTSRLQSGRWHGQ